jgi:hypothetical protein
MKKIGNAIGIVLIIIMMMVLGTLLVAIIKLCVKTIL